MWVYGLGNATVMAVAVFAVAIAAVGYVGMRAFYRGRRGR
jgi:hypothetical protein